MVDATSLQTGGVRIHSHNPILSLTSNPPTPYALGSNPSKSVLSSGTLADSSDRSILSESEVDIVEPKDQIFPLGLSPIIEENGSTFNITFIGGGFSGDTDQGTSMHYCTVE